MEIEDCEGESKRVETECRAYLLFPSFPEVENKEAW